MFLLCVVGGHKGEELWPAGDRRARWVKIRGKTTTELHGEAGQPGEMSGCVGRGPPIGCVEREGEWYRRRGGGRGSSLPQLGREGCAGGEGIGKKWQRERLCRGAAGEDL